MSIGARNTMAVLLTPRQISCIVFCCTLTVLILMIVCLTSSYWITAEKFRQGLIYLCVEPGFSNLKTPFGLDSLEPGCYPNRDAGYIKLTTLLCLITILSTLTATVVTGIGLCSSSSSRSRLQKVSMHTMILGLVCNFIALIIYPTQFMAEIDESNRDAWELNFAYGLGWGSSIILFASIVLLLCEQEPLDVYSYDNQPNKL